MIEIPNPSKNEVEKYLKRWNLLENYTLQEKALDKLFLKTYPNNTDINDVLIKASVLNDFYSTNIFSIFPVAKHILELDIDKRLEENDTTLVNDLAKVKIGNVEKNFYSFATKYCSHHKPKEFPIYDSFVEKCLMHFYKKDNFEEFSKADLKDYTKFKNILKSFKKYYNIDMFDLKDIDKYLWQLGKDYFPKKY